MSPARTGLAHAFACLLVIGCNSAKQGSVIVVDKPLPGANATEVEQQVTRELESALVGAETVVCASRASHARCVARFAKGVLKPGTSPSVDGADVDIYPEPILRFEVKTTGDVDTIVSALETVRGVSGVRVEGAGRREIIVRVDGERARSLGLTPADVSSVLRNETIKNALDITSIPVRKAPLVRISDVAQISDERIGRRPQVFLEITKIATYSTADVQKAVLERLASLGLPPDVQLQRIELREHVAIFVPESDVASSASALRDVITVEVPGGKVGPRASPGTGGELERTVVVDNARAASLGVNPADANNAVRFALAGDPVTKTTEGITVRVVQPVDESAPLGTQLHIMTNRGALVSLAQVAEERLGSGPSALFRRDRLRTGLLCGTVSSAQLNDSVALIRTRLPKAVVETGTLAQVCRVP